MVISYQDVDAFFGSLGWTYVIKLAPDGHFSIDPLDYGLIAVSEGGKIVYFAYHLLICLNVHCHMHGSKRTGAEDGVLDEELVCKLLF